MFFLTITVNFFYSGDPLPRVEYTEKETQTWYNLVFIANQYYVYINKLNNVMILQLLIFNRSTVYKKLMELYPTHACKEFNDALSDFQRQCGYRYIYTYYYIILLYYYKYKLYLL